MRNATITEMSEMSPVPRGDQADKYLFLTKTNDKIYQDMETLWDNHSGYPELLDAGPNRRYTSDPSTISYVDQRSNRAITDTQLRKAVRQISLHQRLEMRKKTQQLISGLILFGVWYTDMQDLMTILYRTIWTLSIGGFLFEDEEKRQLFYLFVIGQFGWLDFFYDQLINKSQAMNGTAMSRAGLYASYGNSMWQNTFLEKMIDFGYEEARRILGHNEHHCYKDHIRQGCIELAQKGWVPIREITPIGNATCYTNCLCHIEYR